MHADFTKENSVKKYQSGIFPNIHCVAGVYALDEIYKQLLNAADVYTPCIR